jgi:hypothetical protein
MRKILILLFAITFSLSCILGALGISASAQQSSAKLRKNGKADPASIPDSVAYEFFIKSLAAAPLEGSSGQRRIEAFTKQAGIKDSQAPSFLAEVQNSYIRLAAFDRRAGEIKDQTWPNPDSSVWLKLKEIQLQKDAAIAEEVNALIGHRTAEIGAQIRQFVNTHVKARVKGYADQPNPGQPLRPHHAFVSSVKTAFGSARFTTASMQMEETVYVYANTAYSPGDDYVYGYGDVSAGASSYGHEYSPRTELVGPCGQFWSMDGGFASVPIELCDGQYDFTVYARQFCPIANTSRDAGSAGDSEAVEPFIRINAFSSFSPLSIGIGGSSVIHGSYSTSRSFAGNVATEWGYELASGNTPIDITICDGLLTLGVPGGATRSIDCEYRPTRTTSTQTRIRAVVVINGTGAAEATRTSASTLTINK